MIEKEDEGLMRGLVGGMTWVGWTGPQDEIWFFIVAYIYIYRFGHG